eukprot:571421-Prymnesium_polylepis.1
MSPARAPTSVVIWVDEPAPPRMTPACFMALVASKATSSCNTSTASVTLCFSLLFIPSGGSGGGDFRMLRASIIPCVPGTGGGDRLRRNMLCAGLGGRGGGDGLSK